MELSIEDAFSIREDAYKAPEAMRLDSPLNGHVHKRYVAMYREILRTAQLRDIGSKTPKAKFVGTRKYDEEVNIHPFLVKQIKTNIKTIIDDNPYEERVIDSHVLPLVHLTREVRFDKPIMNPLPKNLNSTTNLTLKILSLQIKALERLIPGIVQSDLEKVKLEDSTINYWNLSQLLEQAVRISGIKYKPSKEDQKFTMVSEKVMKIVISEDLVLYSSQNIVVLRRGKTTFPLLREHLLMLADVVRQRSLVFIACEIAGQLKIPGYPPRQILHDIITFGDDVLCTQGNKGYDVIALWESLCVGLIISHNDPLLEDNHQFLNAILMKARELISYDKCFDYLLDLLQRMKAIAKDDLNMLSQLFGIYRIWGHPNVDVQGGLNKLKSIATKSRVLNPRMINLTTIEFKSQFCIRFRNKNKRWPKLDLSELKEGNYLRNVIESNELIHPSHPSYHTSDWLKVKSEQNFEVKDSFSYVDLISDKATTYNLEQLREWIEIDGKKGIGPGHERSVIYQWLTKNSDTPLQLLNKIDKYGFDPKEKLMGLYQKEREIKLFPRFYGLCPLQKRMYVVITEAMIANDILPLFPEVTMMDDYSTLNKKMYGMTKESADIENQAFMQYSIDFEKWNTNMRKDETLPIFKFIDGLYGFKNVLSRSHDMFTDNFMYLADGTFTPKVTRKRNERRLSTIDADYPYDDRFIWGLEECDKVWYGHLGGIDGLRQKGWTLFSMCVLRIICQENQLSFNMVCQGDNQVIKINYGSYTNPLEVMNKHNIFKQSMYDTLSKIGPSLKLEETWNSSMFFSYGKQMIYNGRPLISVLKRICRYASQSNEGVPTLDGALSSNTSTLTAAVSSGDEIIIPYILYTIMNITTIHWEQRLSCLGNEMFHLAKERYVIRGPPDRKRKSTCVTYEPTIRQVCHLRDLTNLFIVGILLFPHELGGMPIMLLGHCLIRGFPDPLSQSICLVKMIAETSTNIELRQLLINILKPVLSKTINPAMIMQDPTSINLLRESSATDRFKRFLSDYLQQADWIVNTEAGYLIKTASARQDDLCDWLFSMDPLNPRLGHEILDSTLTGRSVALIGRMNRTNTIAKLAFKNSDENLGRRLENSSRKYNLCVIFQLFVSGTSIPVPDCSRMYADSLRLQSWGRHVSGVTSAPIFESFRVSKNTSGCGSCPDEKGYLLVKISEKIMSLNDISSESLGPVRPYLGGKTREKIPGVGKDYIPSGALVSKALSNMRLVNWGIRSGGNAHALLSSIVSSLSDFPSEVYQTRIQDVSGSLEHRLRDQVTKHYGSLPTLYTTASYIHQTTSTLTEYGKGGGNVNLVFQSLMIACSSLWNIALSCPNIEVWEMSWHYHPDCETCIIPINEEMIEMPKKHNPRSIMSLSINSPLYAKHNDRVKHLLEASTSSSNLAIQDPHLERDQQTIGRLCSTMVKYIINQGMELGDGTPKTRGDSKFPVLWGFKMKSTDVFLWCAYHLLVEMMLRLNVIGHVNFEFLINKVFIRICRLNPQIFNCLHIFINHSFQRIEYSQKPLLVSSPPSNPATLSECSRVAHLCLIRSTLMILDNEMIDINFSKHLVCFENMLTREHPFICQLIHMSILSGDGRYLNLAQHLNRIMATNEDLLQIEMHDARMITFCLTKLLPMGMVEFFLNVVFVDLFFSETNPLERVKQMNDIPITSLTFRETINPNGFINSFKNCGTFHPMHRALFNKTSKMDVDIRDQYIRSSHLTSHKLHLDKPLMFHTTAIFKIVHLLISFIKEDPSFIHCYADGSGGYSLACALIFRDVRIVHQTYLSLRGITDHSIINNTPPAFDAHPELIHKLDTNPTLLESETDITSPLFGDMMTKMYKEDIDLIMCDAEGHAQQDCLKHMKIACNILRLSPKKVIQKIYLNNISNLKYVTSLYFDMGYDIAFYRSHWSTRGNSEVYLCASRIAGMIRPPKEKLMVKGTSLAMTAYMTQSDFQMIKFIKGINTHKEPTHDEKASLREYARSLEGVSMRTNKINVLFPDAGMEMLIPEDIMIQEYNNYFIHGKLQSKRIKFGTNVWSHVLFKDCIWRFYISTLAAQMVECIGIWTLEDRLPHDVMMVWKDRKGRHVWVICNDETARCIIERNDQVKGPKRLNIIHVKHVSLFLKAHEIRLIYQYAGEFSNFRPKLSDTYFRLGEPKPTTSWTPHRTTRNPHMLPQRDTRRQ